MKGKAGLKPLGSPPLLPRLSAVPLHALQQPWVALGYGNRPGTKLQPGIAKPAGARDGPAMSPSYVNLIWRNPPLAPRGAQLEP